jgi:superfamily I DNA/RNA helicase
MARVAPDAWRPRGIPDLEPQAWRALRHVGSASVVAGPGSGKTEFLAQRAVYLLVTGLCPPPYRILAISFKGDAAANLAARVRQRCPPELANRFVSMTFDAFTKGLVDRFQSAIPASRRPTKPYDIAFPTRRQMEDFLVGARFAAPQPWQFEIAELGPLTFEPVVVGSLILESDRVAPQNGIEFAVDRWWHQQLFGAGRSTLTFVSINRLAELLLRSNLHIRTAMRTTYPFVFVDEFQDTTYAQYDMLMSAFAGHAVVTAVGDHKQRIMGWAGARTDAFERFEADFRAQRFPLLFNFRSSPDLVRIQHVVARALDAGVVHTQAQAVRHVDGDVAQIWTSRTREVEANHLAQWIAFDMVQRGKQPRDYALLVRQTADVFEEELGAAFAAAGMSIRNESRLLGRTTVQDLLADEISQVVLAFLRLGASRREPDAWQRASGALQILRALDPDDEAGANQSEAKLARFLADLRSDMASTSPNRKIAVDLVVKVFEFLDGDAISRTLLQYAHGDLLQIMAEAFAQHFANSAQTAQDWPACLAAFAGIGQIPLMTVHKSKGLEYDTIAFLGLDDRAWWSHVSGNPEGIATFFVALSRAKQRALFLFCQERGSRKKVADLFALLAQAGVQEIAI